MHRFLSAIAALAMGIVLNGSANATPVYTFNDGTGHSGTAQLLISGFFAQFDLTNTGNVANTGDVLTGIRIELSQPISSMFPLGLSASEGQVTCTSGGCTSNAPGAQPVTLWSMTFLGNTLTLTAGGGAFAPYGLINDSAFGNASALIGSSNPYLNGVLEVDLLAFMPESTDIVGATAFFGPNGTPVAGRCTEGCLQVPEPNSIWILMSALLLCSAAMFRRRQSVFAATA